MEIISIFLLGLVVIIPTVKGGWNEFSDTRILDIAEDIGPYVCSELANGCVHFYRKSITFFSLFLFLPSKKY